MNKFCDRCLVEVDETLINCPLCGNYLSGEENVEPKTSKTIVYGYPVVSNDVFIKKIFRKVMAFLTVVALIACTAADFLTTGTLDWAYHVYVALGAYWLTLGRVMFFKMEMHRQIMWDCIASIGICFYVQFVTRTGAYHWALHWATPGIILCGIFSLGCMAAFDHNRWGSNIVTMTFLCLLSVVPILLSWVILREVHWFLILLVAVAVVTILAVLVFGNKKYFLEIRKRFHI